MHLDRTDTYRVTPDRLWPLFANTDSLNREVGLPPVDYKFERQEQGGTRIRARARAVGLNMEWEEPPWEWTWPRHYSVKRVFTKGPFKEFRANFEAFSEGGGTRVKVSIDFEPNGLIGSVIASTAAKKSVNDMFEAARNFERFLLGNAPSPYPKRYGKAVVEGTQLIGALKRLSDFPVKKALVERLGRFVAEEVDEHVRDVRPFRLADDWREDRIEVLRLCLWATRAGLLDLRWHVICPVCHGSKRDLDTMRKLTVKDECESCNVNFGLDMERRVEARFTPNRAIRSVGTTKFCFGGPMNTPHVVMQGIVDAGQTRTLTLDFPHGAYLVRRGGSLAAIPLTVGPGPTEAAVTVEDGAEAAITLAPNGRLAVRNARSTPVKISIERVEKEEEQAATAAIVTTLQEFRDLFATEALAPGVELAIGSLALLFSDLKGSTAMYDKIGDAPAYAIVRRHFEFMVERVRRLQGAVVKTMGDAVMAVFRSPLDAVRCALVIQREWKEPSVGIKIGVHAGPCIAVTSTDYLDYFGSTVNIAARTQAQSVGGDIVISDPVLKTTGVQAAIDEMGAHESTFSAALKGFETQFTLHRIVFGNPGETMLRR
jgi:class 3 adenylate cyclase